MTISESTPLRVVVLLTSVAVALALLLTITVVARADAGSDTQVVSARVEHEVRPGDTLWDIAALYGDPGDDTRELIQDIKVLNGLDTSVIVVGQVLTVPVDF